MTITRSVLITGASVADGAIYSGSGGGLSSTANDYIRFTRALLNGGFIIDDVAALIHRVGGSPIRSK